MYECICCVNVQKLHIVVTVVFPPSWNYHIGKRKQPVKHRYLNIFKKEKVLSVSVHFILEHEVHFPVSEIAWHSMEYNLYMTTDFEA